MPESRIESLQRKILTKTTDSSERKPVVELSPPPIPAPQVVPIDNKPARQKILRYRHIAALIIFWGVTLAVVGYLFGSSLLRSSAAGDVKRKAITIVEAAPVTALSHFSLAQETALAWEEDVELVSASAKWDRPSLDKFEQPVEWFYRFYSPRLQHFLFVIVTADQAVVARPHLTKIRQEVRRIDWAAWTVDSPTALTTWFNDGGGRMWLRQSDPGTISVQLLFSLSENQPVWVVSGQDIGGRTMEHTLPATSPDYQP